MANIAATIANKGYYYTPHLVKEIDDTVFDKSFIQRHDLPIAKKNFDIVTEGMYQVVNGGPGYSVVVGDKRIGYLRKNWYSPKPAW